MQYTSGCPNADLARRGVEQAARALPAPVTLRVQRFGDRALTDESVSEPAAGSPTILLNGSDLFPGSAVTGAACRRYATSDGPQGAPTVTQLRAALARRLAQPKGDQP